MALAIEATGASGRRVPRSRAVSPPRLGPRRVRGRLPRRHLALRGAASA